VALSLIEQFADTVVSLDGATPNALSADLDLNGQQILNPAPAVLDREVPSLGQVRGLIDGAASGLLVQRKEQSTATASQTLVTLTTVTYQPGSNNLAVYKNGVRLFAGADYTETSTSSYTLIVPATAGHVYTAVVNDFLGSVSLDVGAVPWANITGAPATATRDPTYAEVTNKPVTYPPDSHTHPASAIASGRVADAQRGVFVQPTAPSSPTVGDLWMY
jgi:hypothetical protein